ncbi:hypothetical protein BU26DRAFT_274359 [Trematosphaeria pertusa]|uniref:Uncharacterized protein n=1 Tax=Trematosphaeria pertusa TaxID=390896 RepID=A0A6A6IKP9_9PLEO|nr:uncharacterized protein BU26DRAFT_274359 [Trematosphaeria pertusa]KAF2250991.1 hypothetical protein BU26DRAFT_274359 [Trematosphaeria pertusa]
MHRQTGLPKSEVHLFDNHFAHFPGFQPEKTAPFAEEFVRLARSQGWEENSQDYRVQQVAALMKEYDCHFPTPQVNEDNVELGEEEKELRRYQLLCRECGKKEGDTVEECVSFLQGKPYTNIVDLIDKRRTGQPIELFSDFRKFKKYTLKTPGKCIDRNIAKEDGLLRSLLQDFRRGPDPNGTDRVLRSNSRDFSGRVQKTWAEPKRRANKA